MFSPLPASPAEAAVRMLAGGWKPQTDPGQLQDALGGQGTAHQVDDRTWQAMCLMELLTTGPSGTVSASVRRPVVAPSFDPGSGWYKTGHCSPGSMIDRKETRAAALPCTVVVLRRQGVRLPAAQRLRVEPPSGYLLCMARYTEPNWHACQFGDPDMKTELLPRLMHARLERESRGYDSMTESRSTSPPGRSGAKRGCAPQPRSARVKSLWSC